MEKNKSHYIIFTRTEVIDGRICNTDFRESDIIAKYGKSYFEMTREEKAEAEYYFCENPDL